jgi:signal transduction histidine kinase
MDLYVLISFINGFVAILFGLFIVSKNWKNTTNLTFFLMSLAVAVWSFSYCKWLSVYTAHDALFWSRMLNLGATFIPIFYLHWILSILNLTKEKKPILIFGYVIVFIFSVFSFTPLYITSVKPVLDFPFWPQAGILYVAYLIFGYMFLTFYGFYELIKAKKGVEKEKEHQINYLILGSLFGFGGGATNFPLMFGVALFPPIGQTLVVLYTIVFGLATLKYHLFEIKLILTELLVGVMGIIIVVLLYLMPTPSLKVLIAVTLALFLVFGYYLVKATREEIERKEEAERVSRVKTEFISIASHQLRTPLAAIRGYTSMIKDGDYGKIPDEAMVAVNYIYESSIGMIKLVNSLLSISRLERGQVELKIEEVSVEPIIENCIKDIQLLARGKGLYLKYIKPARPLPTIKGDPEKLKEVFNNIINNAVLYTVKGGVTVSMEKKKNSILIQVKDTGIGILKKEKEKIFKSFSRGQAGTEMYTQGTGLGLYVAKNFLEMHKGKLTVRSKGKDKGSTFFIELPIKSNPRIRHEFVLKED